MQHISEVTDACDNTDGLRYRIVRERDHCEILLVVHWLARISTKRWNAADAEESNKRKTNLLLGSRLISLQANEAEQPLYQPSRYRVSLTIINRIILRESAGVCQAIRVA